MNIKKIEVGLLSTNCYLVIKENKCLIIDPGDNKNKIIETISELNLLPSAILITHNHFDHIGAKKDLEIQYHIKTYDYYNLNEGIISIDIFTFKLIHTPGHTSDSVTYYFEDEKTMFVGDFIFYESIGRTDLDTASENDMFKSIQKIKKYDQDIILYPGHDQSTTLAHEIENNYYFK